MFDTDIITILDKGESLFKANKTEEAERYYLTMLNQGYKHKEIYNNIGVIAFYKNDITKASSYLNEALRIDPYYKTAIINIYNLFKTNKNYKVPCITEYLKRYPNDQEIKQINEEILHLNRLEKIAPIKHIKEIKKNEQIYVERIKNIYKDKNIENHKAHRNVILTGIPGSGITLLSNLLNRLDNTICIDNEFNDVYLLPQKYSELRSAILNRRIKTKNKLIDEDVIIGFRLNLAYLFLNFIQGIKQNILNDFGYKIIAIIRDPVFTIASWNTEKYKNLPEAMISDDKLSPRWNGIKFSSNNKFERQAQIWQFYAETFLKIYNVMGGVDFWGIKIEPIKIYTYEQLTLDMENLLKDICHYLSVPFIDSMEIFSDIDYESANNITEQIKEAVEKYCPSRSEFGYNDSFIDTNVLSLKSPEFKEQSSGSIDFNLNQQ